MKGEQNKTALSATSQAAKEDDPRRLPKTRDKLQEKVGEVYAKFDEIIDEENARSGEKRREILSRERSG